LKAFNQFLHQQFSNHQSSNHQSSNHQFLNMQSSNQNTGQQKSPLTTDLACLFTKVTKGGKPALVARMSIHVDSVRSDLSTLLYHAEALNLRLLLLRVSIQATSAQTVSDPTQPPHLFVLSGLFKGDVRSQTMSEFLTHLAQDFKTFLLYTQAHQIQLKLTDAY
ncbi:MAG: hypothetical protein WA901_04680, partial [Phormidesmis sp.]